LDRQHGAAGKREDGHAERVDGPGQEPVHAAVRAVAEADGRVPDDGPEPVAALPGGSRHGGGVGEVVRARRHGRQRRHALRRRRRGVRGTGRQQAAQGAALQRREQRLDDADDAASGGKSKPRMAGSSPGGSWTPAGRPGGVGALPPAAWAATFSASWLAAAGFNPCWAWTLAAAEGCSAADATAKARNSAMILGDAIAEEMELEVLEVGARRMLWRMALCLILVDGDVGSAFSSIYSAGGVEIKHSNVPVLILDLHDRRSLLAVLLI
jgi:hypothetical protein